LVWCDKLASTPGIGFTFDGSLAPSASILAALAPVFEESIRGDNDQLHFTIDRFEPFVLQITLFTGYQYGVTHSQISVEFMHRLKLRQTSAGPPVAELTSQPLPFTVLMPEISKRLVEATMLLPGIKTRKIKRIGIISTTALDEAIMPPGIARFVKYICRPWQGAVDRYSFAIHAELSRNSRWTDKCLHILTKPGEPDQLPTLKFDWQRWLDPSQSIRREVLEALLREAEMSAMAYFEELAEGNRFDEDLLRAGT
jgi:hypothetical protein